MYIQYKENCNDTSGQDGKTHVNVIGALYVENIFSELYGETFSKVMSMYVYVNI